MKKGIVLTLAFAIVMVAGFMLVGHMHQGFVMGLIPKPGS